MSSPAAPADSNALFVNLAVEAWRFARVFARAVSRLEVTDQSKYIGQQRYFLQRLEQALEAVELRLVGFDGSRFDPGLPITAVNLSDFGPDDELVIDQTLEPAVLGPNGVVRMGSAMLRKAG
jgi:hypothetical protein